jgi:hypothetical protein
VQGHAAWRTGPVRGRTDFSSSTTAWRNFRFGSNRPRNAWTPAPGDSPSDRRGVAHAPRDRPAALPLRGPHPGRLGHTLGLQRQDQRGALHPDGETRRRRQGVGLAPRGAQPIARSVRALHLAGRHRARNLLVRRERPRLEPRPAASRSRNQAARRSHLADRPSLHAPHIPNAPAHPHVRANGHAGQADARNARELPALVSRAAGHQHRAGGEFRVYGCLLLLGRGGALLCVLSRLQELFRL